MHIHLVAVTTLPPAGVDTPEDLERVRAMLMNAGDCDGQLR
jgi:CMP-2-keto-3-deoxyoctulosonic acid synthetase